MALSMVYPPNRPLERSLGPSKIPVMYDYLLFLDVNTKGELLIGSSNVSGTYWEGTLHYFLSFGKIKENAYNGYFISNTTNSDALFIDDDHILYSEDDGTLRIFSNRQQSEGDLLVCEKRFLQSHRVNKLSTWGASKAVACYDSSIDLYNIQNEIISLEKTYNNYHVDTIKYVDTHKSDSNIFASASMDRKVCLWDIRLANPAAIVIYQSEFCPLTSVVFHKNVCEQLTIGSDSGAVYSVDIRTPKETLSEMNCFDSSIHKMAYNNNGHLAVCGDTSKIVTLKTNDLRELEKVKVFEEHKGVVRGIVWFDNILYSCGFNKEIFCNVV